MKKNRAGSILTQGLLLLIILLCPCLWSRPTERQENRFAEAEARMEKAVASPQVPSLSVAVAQGGKIVWEKAVGFADIENGMIATPATAYSLASISKPITATGLMILVERGLVELDKSANQYLGKAKLHSYSHNADKATVLRLLNHTSGLVTHWHFFYADDPYIRPEMDETIRRYGILFLPPGLQYMYSNLGYGILGNIIERVSGMPYPQFMTDEVFKPLGMTNSTVYVEQGPEAKVAQRYMGRGKRIPFYDFDHRGASAVYCSARDLVRFGMFHLKDHLPDQKQIISDETIDSMKSLRDPDVAENDYRLGWSLSHLGKYKAVSHGGGMPGVSTNLLLLPELDIALVLLCNASYRGLRQIGQTVLEALIPDLKQELSAQQNPQPKPDPEPLETPESLLGRWEGEIITHEGNVPVELVIEKGKKITFRLTGKEHKEDKPVGAFGRVILREDLFNARFFVKIPTEDASRFPHQTDLTLEPHGNSMSGAASAYAINTRFGLPYYISLRKLEK